MLALDAMPLPERPSMIQGIPSDKSRLETVSYFLTPFPYTFVYLFVYKGMFTRFNSWPR